MADLAMLLRLPSAAEALRAIERELIAGDDRRFAVSTVLEALAEGFSDVDQLEQVLQMLARRDAGCTAAIRWLISMCGVERAMIVKRLSSLQKGGAHG